MASYIENELPLLHVSLLVTTEIAFIVGSVTHVFIIAVNVIDWRKERTMSTSDQVIISIMISRMILQSVIHLNLFGKLLSAMCYYIYEGFMRTIFFFAMYSSLWLSTLLCVVFYLKISNFRRVFLLQLRILFAKKILHFIMASLLVSICQVLLNYLSLLLRVAQNVSLNSAPFNAMFAVSSAGMLGPLLIYLLSSLFLITSLYLHIRHMRCNGNVTSSLYAYYRIIKYSTGSIFTSVLCVIISVLADRYSKVFGFVFSSFTWTAFGTLHSMLLIYATPKLKTPFSRILKDLSNCWTKREEPRDLEMTVTA